MTTAVTPLTWGASSPSTHAGDSPASRAYKRTRKPAPVSALYTQVASATLDMSRMMTSWAGNPEVMTIARDLETIDPEEYELAAMSQKELEAAILATRGLWAGRADIEDILSWRKEDDGLDQLFAWKLNQNEPGQHGSDEPHTAV